MSADGATQHTRDVQPIPIIDPDLPYVDEQRTVAGVRSPLDLTSTTLSAIVATTLLWFSAAGVLVWSSVSRTANANVPAWFEAGPIVPLTGAFAVASFGMYVMAVAVPGHLRRLRCGLISFLAAAVAVLFGLRLGDALDLRWLVLPTSYLVGTLVPRLLSR